MNKLKVSLIITNVVLILISVRLFFANKKINSLEKRIEHIEKVIPTFKDVNFVLDEFQQTADSLLFKVQQNKQIKQLEK